ncbi:unnamed protein product [Spodoptera exigua]|nr:unnamed protein product [Spodoptera exigua]
MATFVSLFGSSRAHTADTGLTATAAPRFKTHLKSANEQTYYLMVRRTALKKLLLKDFMEEDCELRNIGLAYAPSDP